ncbi:MAG TPA: protein phosphatase 2C domain-containing protein [Oscillatoriaceae cyanobacterium M33_DOE_052]|uniref:Protein phosphatase n=1 Tax=Planktothricoides sp. SpSt-374 TaxID=2282167 RepID=A0A7C3ZZP1_9CYAN|nr:protein phosphatase 2C domain-containing protein [Oscillatoriaceae cyanobacterium M33_DOE_052]
MKQLFELAPGSIGGTRSRRQGKNNQDAYYSRSGPDATVAVVCDGCGSGKHSEVGAKIGARLVVEAIARLLPNQSHTASDFWELVQQEVLLGMKTLALNMGGDRNSVAEDIVYDYFLFTIVGALITPEGATIFAKGDGVIFLNGEYIPLGPFANNAPPYLGYALISPESDRWQWEMLHAIPLESVQSILIGTDGVLDLMQLATTNLPGKPEAIGSISQFWAQDRYFQNPDMVRRQLHLINRELSQINWEQQEVNKQGGYLPDDTTIIAIRRRR